MPRPLSQGTGPVDPKPRDGPEGPRGSDILVATPVSPCDPAQMSEMPIGAGMSLPQRKSVRVLGWPLYFSGPLR